MTAISAATFESHAVVTKPSESQSTVQLLFRPNWLTGWFFRLPAKPHVPAAGNEHECDGKPLTNLTVGTGIPGMTVHVRYWGDALARRSQRRDESGTLPPQPAGGIRPARRSNGQRAVSDGSPGDVPCSCLLARVGLENSGGRPCIVDSDDDGAAVATDDFEA